MAEISASLVKELRERTGVGMMDCRKALVATEGDMDAAIKYLREKGISKAESKAVRETKEGIIHSYIHFNKKIGVLVELNCETDFVARTEGFEKLADEIALQIAAASPLAVSADQIDPAIIASEREIARNKALNDGKKEDLVDRIVDGHIKKFCSEHALLEQELLSDPKRTVKDLLTDSIGSTGENIVIARFVRFNIG